MKFLRRNNLHFYCRLIVIFDGGVANKNCESTLKIIVSASKFRKLLNVYCNNTKYLSGNRELKREAAYIPQHNNEC